MGTHKGGEVAVSTAREDKAAEVRYSTINRDAVSWGERVGIEPTTDLFRARHRI